MSRNFGLGSRNMSFAVKMILNIERVKGRFSYATVDSVAKRFKHFQNFAKKQGVSRLEQVDENLVKAYSQHLKNSTYSNQYKHALLSAVNTAMDSVRAYANAAPWVPVTARKQGIEMRDFVRTNQTISNIQYQMANKAMTPRVQALSSIAREFGLRLKEAALLDNKKALREALKHGRLSIEKGTKGGKKRTIPVTNERQIHALKNAAAIQAKGRSLIPEGQNYHKFLNSEIKANRPILRKTGIHRFHELRSAYAAQRYEELTGHPASVNGGTILDRERDREVRLQISAELGHGRIEVVASYIGGRT